MINLNSFSKTVRAWLVLGTLGLGLTHTAGDGVKRDFPLVFNHNFNVKPPMSHEQIVALAKRDLVILSPVFRRDYADIAAIRKLNPNIILLHYAGTFSICYNEQNVLGNDDEVAYLRASQCPLVSGTVAKLSAPMKPEDEFLPLAGEVPAVMKMAAPPLLTCGEELMRVEKIEGTRIRVSRGCCGTRALALPAGTALAKVSQPKWGLDWTRKSAEGAEAYFINISDIAPIVNGRQPWQMRADYLIEHCWNNPEWRKAFDGFFLDEGQAEPAGRVDVDRDGTNDDAAKVHHVMQAGLRKMCARLREKCGPEMVVVFNNTPDLIPGASGRHREEFVHLECPGEKQQSHSWNWAHGIWAYGMEPYWGYLATGYSPAIVLNSCQPGSYTNFRQMRFGLASTLLGDGFFQNRAFSGDRGNWKHWFDEYSVDRRGKATDGSIGRHWLGKPSGPARQWTVPLATPNQSADVHWKLDQNQPALATGTLKVEKNALQIIIQASQPALPATVQVSGTISGDLKPQTEYTLNFETRANQPVLFEAVVLDGEGNANVAKILIPVFATSEWRKCVFTVMNHSPKPLSNATLAWGLTREAGQYAISLRDIQWQEGAGEKGWTRDFEHGMVLVNPGLKTQTFSGLAGYQKILGQQDPIHNNGAVVGDVLPVAPVDAFLLFKSENH